MTIQERVKHLLETEPHLRHDFYGLSVFYWAEEMREMGFEGSMFLTLYQHGKLTSEETIQRHRRTLQKKHEHLQGKDYLKNKEKEQEVKNQAVIGDLTSIWR